MRQIQLNIKWGEGEVFCHETYVQVETNRFEQLVQQWEFPQRLGRLQWLCHLKKLLLKRELHLRWDRRYVSELRQTH